MKREFFLYSRKECRPCEVFKAELELVLGGSEHIVRVIHIEDDAELEHQYGARIPVLVCGTTEICELRFDPSSLSSFLAATDV